MNKTKLITTLIVLGGVVFAGSVLAATNLSFSPASVNVTSGETFNMVVSVNPQEIKNYTIKTEIEFPADLLEVKSFSFGNNWMPLSQTGYNLIDNTNGLLIKTAGYPGGLSSAATFGTISFLAKKDGTGSISVGNNSFALDATNQDLLSGAPQASIVITASVPAETPPAPVETPPSTEIPTTEEPVIPNTSGEEEEELEATTTEGEIVDTQPEQQQPEENPILLAGIINFITFGTNKAWVGIIISIIILLIIYFIIRGVRTKRSNNQE